MRKILTLMAMLLGCSGCVFFAAGAVGGVVAHGEEKLDENGIWRDFDASLEPTWEATRAELASMEVEVKNDAKLGARSGRFSVKGGYVEVVRHPKYDYTRVYVKIGTFPSEEKHRIATEFLDAIAERVGDTGLGYGTTTRETPRPEKS